jgi:general secretion pathway protein L
MTSATINWRQRVRDSANRVGLPRFWRWWMGELAPLLPGASRAALQRRFARPVIELHDGQAVFWRAEINRGVARLAVTESVPLAGEPQAVLAAGRAAVARLAANASAGIAAPKVIVALEPRQVLRKELTLPAAVEENLTQTLAYDLDRHTPFRADQVYFDAAVTGRDAARKTLRVDWVAALKTVVDTARKQIEDWGAIPVAVVPGPPTSPTRLNLLPTASRPRPLQWRRWQVWAPLALLALLVAAVVLVPLLQKRQYAIALADSSTEAGQQAAVADKLRSQLEQVQSDYNYVLAKKYAFPSAVHVLDEVTRVLPDDTWITQLELKTGGRGKEAQRDLYLRGESANAGKLISLLEDSKLVELVAPRSPTTKIQGSSGEIFDLGAKLRALPTPTPVVLADLPPAPRPPASDPARAAAPNTAPAAAANPPPAPSALANKSAPAPAPINPASIPPPPQQTSPTTAAGFGPFPDRPPIPAGPPVQRGGRAARAAQQQVPPAPGAVPPPAQAGTVPVPPQGAVPSAPPPGMIAPAVPAEAAPDAGNDSSGEGEPKEEE